MLLKVLAGEGEKSASSSVVVLERREKLLVRVVLLEVLVGEEGKVVG